MFRDSRASILVVRGLEILILELAVVVAVCSFTAVPWKMLRFCMDFQYNRTRGEANELVQDGATAAVRRVFTVNGSRTDAFADYVQQLREQAYITWPRLRDYSDEWLEQVVAVRSGASASRYLRCTRRAVPSCGVGVGGGCDADCDERVTANHDSVADKSLESASGGDIQRNADADVRPAGGNGRGHVGVGRTGIFIRKGGFGVGECGGTILFLHGGGLISGSPLKRNPYNWITTIAHFTRYRWLLCPFYSLAPENSSPRALMDVLDCLFDHTARFDGEGHGYVGQLGPLVVVAFSAGGFLAMQVTLLLHAWHKDSATQMFGVSAGQLPGFTKERLALLHGSLVSVQLCCALLRVDRLFVNTHVDVSAFLADYIRVYTEHPTRDDPMLAAARLSAAALQPLFRLYDVARNSMSNHAVQLHAILRRVAARPSELRVYPTAAFDLDPWLLVHGDQKNKFLRDARIEPKHDAVSLSLNPIHYHFFPFIVGTRAGREITRDIVFDLRALLDGWRV